MKQSIIMYSNYRASARAVPGHGAVWAGSKSLQARTDLPPPLYKEPAPRANFSFLFSSFFFILTLFDESGDQEYLAIGWEACIAQRGADRLGLSLYGAVPGVIFVCQSVSHTVFFFVVLAAACGDMRKKTPARCIMCRLSCGLGGRLYLHSVPRRLIDILHNNRSRLLYIKYPVRREYIAFLFFPQSPRNGAVVRGTAVRMDGVAPGIPRPRRCCRHSCILRRQVDNREQGQRADTSTVPRERQGPGQGGAAQEIAPVGAQPADGRRRRSPGASRGRACCFGGQPSSTEGSAGPTSRRRDGAPRP